MAHSCLLRRSCNFNMSSETWPHIQQVLLLDPFLVNIPLFLISLPALRKIPDNGRRTKMIETSILRSTRPPPQPARPRPHPHPRPRPRARTPPLQDRQTHLLTGKTSKVSHCNTASGKVEKNEGHTLVILGTQV